MHRRHVKGAVALSPFSSGILLLHKYPLGVAAQGCCLRQTTDA
jgi:hypothetical protein